MIFSGEKTKLNLNEKKKKAEYEAKTQASPCVVKTSRYSNKKEVTRDDLEVVERLYNYHKLYEGKKISKQQQRYNEVKNEFVDV